MRQYRLLIVNDFDDLLDEHEIEVLDETDAKRLTHPLQAQEFAEVIQSAILSDDWD